MWRCCAVLGVVTDWCRFAGAAKCSDVAQPVDTDDDASLKDYAALNQVCHIVIDDS
jgi:hypothetical protein